MAIMENDQIIDKDNSQRTAYFKDNFDFVDECVLINDKYEIEQLPLKIETLDLDDLESIEE